MIKKTILLYLKIFLIAVAVNAMGQTSGLDNPVEFKNRSPYRYPLKIAVGKERFLTDQDNKPFFWSGDAAWSLIAELSKEDASYYLDNRKRHGFSVIMVNLIEHKFCKNAPANFYGEMPFTGKPFITPGEGYFEHADYVIRSAAERNIVVLLDPVYLGYDCKDEGWCAEVMEASEEDMHQWGSFLGKRFSGFKNIVWLIGGDTDPYQVRSKIIQVVRGIQEYDTIHLMTAHNQPGSMAVTPWQGETWLSVNNVYSYDSLVYRQFKEAYGLIPEMPYFQIESAYENEHKSTPQQLRSQAYWAILSGAMGHVFGNCPIWHFGSFQSWCGKDDWKEELDNSGSESMDNLQRLFRSREWQKLVPDFDHRVIISGYGKWGSKDYVTGAETSDRKTIIAYLPSERLVTVDMEKIGGKKSKCWWFNPADGSVQLIGVYDNSGPMKFITPSSGDWVLVIDEYSSDLQDPGS